MISIQSAVLLLVSCINIRFPIYLLNEIRFRFTYQVGEEKNWPFPFNTFIPLRHSVFGKLDILMSIHLYKMWINCWLLLTVAITMRRKIYLVLLFCVSLVQENVIPLSYGNKKRVIKWANASKGNHIHAHITRKYAIYSLVKQARPRSLFLHKYFSVFFLAIFSEFCNHFSLACSIVVHLKFDICVFLRSTLFYFDVWR